MSNQEWLNAMDNLRKMQSEHEQRAQAHDMMIITYWFIAAVGFVLLAVVR